MMRLVVSLDSVLCVFDLGHRGFGLPGVAIEFYCMTQLIWLPAQWVEVMSLYVYTRACTTVSLRAL